MRGDSRLKRVLNEVLFPFKLLIPQPIIEKIPGLTTNEDIRMNKVLESIAPKHNCLDIGCGSNKLMRMQRARGGIGIGVDVYNWGDVDVIVEDTSKLEFEDASFDVITFVACLNHVPNRDEVLMEARRLLRKGGRVILTMLTPKLSLIWHKWAFWDDDQHERGMKEGEVYGLTHEEISTLLESAGLKLVKKSKFAWGLNNLYIAEKGGI